MKAYELIRALSKALPDADVQIHCMMFVDGQCGNAYPDKDRFFAEDFFFDDNLRIEATEVSPSGKTILIKTKY